jgi:regulator of chromosome condensation
VVSRRKIHGTVPEKITLVTRSRKAIAIGAGNNHSFAVDEDGDVWGWGMNAMGQTGTGWTNSSDSEIFLPKKVIGLSKEELNGETVVEVVGGDQHTLFRTSNGSVYACGRCNAGQLGLPDDHPALVGSSHPNFVAEPTLVPFPEDDDPVVQISAGPLNSMAVTAGGALYVWGQGVQSELGAGDQSEIRTPKTIVRREGGSWTAVAVSCGGQHSLALLRKKLT